MYKIIELDQFINKSGLVENSVFKPQYTDSAYSCYRGDFVDSEGDAELFFVTKLLNTPKQADGLVKLVFDSQCKMDKKSYLSEYASSNDIPELKKLLMKK